MNNRTANQILLPHEQETIRAKCFHPTGTFNEFKKETEGIPAYRERELGTEQMGSLLTELESLTAEEANHLLADNRISNTDKIEMSNLEQSFDKRRKAFA